MPSKIAAPSRVVSRKAVLPGRFNVSRILFSPKENAEFPNFDYSSTTPEVPKALRRTSGSLPGTRSETRPDPGSSIRINTSFSHRKTTLFRSQDCHLGTTSKPQPPAPVVIFLDPTLYHSLYRTQLADAPGSADSEGLRPHAPTLEKRSQPNVPFRSNLKVIEINGFRAFC